eukprot:COSAG02_NODE_2907_length_7770_cov_137.176770_4_plen_582_part_00
MVDAAKAAHKTANEVFKSGDYPAAAEAYTVALRYLPVIEAQPSDGPKRDPVTKAIQAHEVTLLSNRAECYLREGELALAQLDVDRALALDPKHAKTIKRHGRVAERRHAVARAKAEAMAARNIKMHEAVLIVQEQLIDGVDSGAKLAELGSQINASHFLEVVEERVQSLSVCGYPMCSCPVKKIQSGKLVLSPQKSQIFETVQPQYCSTQCKRCAQDFVDSLPEAPVVIAADNTPVSETVSKSETLASQAKNDQPAQEHRDAADVARTARQERVVKIEVIERPTATSAPSRTDARPEPRPGPELQPQPQQHLTSELEMEEPEPESEPEPEPEPERELAISDQIGFVPSDSFRGVRAGSVYTLGKYGLGYYQDLGASAGEMAISLPQQPLKKQKNDRANKDSNWAEHATGTANSGEGAEQAGREGKRAHEVVPKVSPFLGTYYTLQQWCNPTSVRAFAVSELSSSRTEPSTDQQCVIAHPAELGELESEVCEALQGWMSKTCQELALKDLIASNASREGASMRSRLASFAACAGAAGGLDYNGSHGCHTHLLPMQWQSICLAIGAVLFSMLNCTNTCHVYSA